MGPDLTPKHRDLPVSARQPSDAVLQSRSAERLHNCLGSASLHLDGLTKSLSCTSLPCRLDPCLEHAQPRDCELACLLHLSCRKRCKLIQHLGALALLETALGGQGVSDGTLSHGLAGHCLLLHGDHC